MALDAERPVGWTRVGALRRGRPRGWKERGFNASPEGSRPAARLGGVDGTVTAQTGLVASLDSV